MKIDDIEATLKLSMNEIDELSFIISQYLKHSIENHYNKLQQGRDGEPVFFDHKEHNLKMLKSFLSMIGREFEYEYRVNEYKEMFSRKREERESNAKD